MKKLLPLFIAFALSSSLLIAKSLTHHKGAPSLSTDLRFEENRGQIARQSGIAAAEILYTMKDRGVNIYFTRTGVLYKWTYADPKSAANKLPANHPLKNMRPEATEVQVAYTRMNWLKSNPNVKVEADSAYRDVSNYYLSGKLTGNVKAYKRITYKNIYPNTDVVYYIKGNKLEYDVVMRPGSDLSKVKFSYTGNNTVQKVKGTIKYSNSLGSVTEGKPVSFVNDKALSTSYTHSDNTVSFNIDQIEQLNNKTVVIDPSLTWGTYYGGGSEDAATSTATDALGNVYLAGYTQSTSNIATPGAQQSGGGGTLNYDAMLVKFDSNGNRLWATYYGGSSADLAYGVATDGDNNVIIAGYSQSNFMATPGGAQTERAGDFDALVVKFNSNGTRIWATYYGGPVNAFGIVSGEDAAMAVTTDASGNIYFTGYTYSQNFPVKSATPHQATLAGGYDAFIVKLNSAGAASFSTYYGGNSDESGRGIAVRGSQVYVTGETNSLQKISTSGSQQPVYGGGGQWDAFLTAFSLSGAQIWGTYYGGTPYHDRGYGVATDSEGYVYMTGSAATPGLGTIATPGSFKQNNSGNEDAFLAKFSSAGVRQWGTYYGASATDVARAITINATDDIFIGGDTKGGAGIAEEGFDNEYAPSGGFPSTTDGWVAKFKKDGTRQWGSFIGGSGDDAVFGLATAGNYVYMAGITNSTSGIASGGFQFEYGGGVSDGFLVKAEATNNVVVPPTVSNASNIVFSDITASSVKLNWTRGTGTARVVAIRSKDADFPNPMDGGIYPNNNNYGFGYPVDADTKIIYRGTDNTVTVTGLTNNITYYFKVFDYTGTFERDVVYIRDSNTGNPASVTMGKTQQTITFDGPVSKSYGTTDFEPATSSSGLRVTYSSDNTSVINIVDGKLHTVGVGTANVTATQAGNATYAAATPVTRVVNVTGATLLVKAANKQKVYGQANPAFTATYSGFVNFENESVITSQPTFVTSAVAGSPAGLYNIIPSGGSATNYILTYESGVFEILKAGLTVRADDKTKMQNEANPALTLTYTGFIGGDNASVITTLPTASTTATTASPAGTYPITVSGGVATSYNFTYQPGTLTVTPALITQTINFAPFEPTFADETDFYANGTASSGLPVSYVSSNTAVAIILSGDAEHGPLIHIVGAGTTTITASQAGNPVYAPATSIPRTLTVSKRDQVLTFEPFADVRLLDPDFFADGHINSGLDINYTSSNPSVATIVRGNMVHVTGLGTTTITASQVGNGVWNAAAPIARTLTVIKAWQGVLLHDFEKVEYGYPDFEPRVTIFVGVAPVFTSSNPAVATVTPDGKKIHIVAGGSTTITAIQPETAIYFASGPSAEVLTVDRIDQTITFSPFPNKLLGDPDFDVVASTTSGLPLTYTSSDPTIATVNSSGTIHILRDGNTIITVSQPGNTNYKPARSVTRTLNIFTREPQTITLAPFEDEEVIAADFYASGVATSGLKVSYISSNPAVATIVHSDDALGDLIHITGIGTTTITASQAGDPYWLPAPNVSRVLRVVKANQYVSFEDFSGKIAYGMPDFSPRTTVSSGLPVTFTSSNPAVATITGDGKIHIVGAGTTEITVSQPGNAIYNAAPPFTRTLTIEKADQTITFAAIAPKTLIDTDFDPAATASSGLAVTYSSNNTGVATIVAGKVHIVGIGTAKITATQLGNANYNPAATLQQDIVVSKAAQTITFAAIPNLNTNVTHTLVATSSSGLPVTFTVSDTKARVSGGTLTTFTAGTVTVTATQAGNDTYAAATAVTRTFTITQPPTVRPNNIITPNGDGINDSWIIADIGSFPDSRIQVYDRAGREVYAFTGVYNNNWMGTSRSGAPLAQDAYFYRIDLGNGSVLQGSITIIRN